MLGGTGFIGQQNCARAVIHPAGVARGHRAIWAHHAFKLCQFFQTGFTRMLVFVHHDGLAFFLRNADRRDFLRQDARLLCGHCLHLAGQSHAVLGLALNFVIGGHVLCGFGHGVHAVHGFHQGVDKTPANRGVKNLRIAPKSCFGFGHHKRRTAHALHAASNHQSSLTCANGAGCRTQGVHARTTQTVDGGTRNFKGQTRQQAGHVRHIAVVLAGLVDATVKHITHRLPVHTWVSRHQSL